jgi:outer membrane protein OmpA-like peptidoglycan-associated protein
VLAAFVLALATVLTPVAAASAQAVAQPTTNYPAGQGNKLTGIIITRMGDTLVVRNDASEGGGISWVTLNPGTKVYSPSGVLNIARKGQDRAQLIPGLIVKVYGSGDPNGNLAADRISFHKSAEKVAAQTSAGEVALSDSIAAVRSRGRDAAEAINARVSNLDNYDVKDRSVVNFAPGSAALDESAKATLSDIVTRNQGLTGFVVEVDGFADATGSPDMNQRLSQQRANTVAAYLTEVSSVPVRRIPNPRGLGTSRPVATNDTAAGRAQNRRAEVRVLVNRGISSSSR